MKKFVPLGLAFAGLACMFAFSFFAPSPSSKKKAAHKKFACDSCTGISHKCINNICETGVYTLESSVHTSAGWACSYAYVFSDGSVSTAIHTHGTSPCSF